MNLKDQMTEDMKNVFLNENEFAIAMTIDGISVFGIFTLNSGSYDEGVPTAILSSDIQVDEQSIVSIEGRNYSVISVGSIEFGQRKILLGNVL